MDGSAFSVRDGRLYVEELACTELAARFGTPLYVMSETRLRSNVRRLGAALERIQGSQARQISRHPVLLHDPGGVWDGVACCYIADPDGNILELIQRPRTETTVTGLEPP